MMDIRTAARILRGSVTSGGISCPGPGHSTHDRSLFVKLDASAPDGFYVTSYARPADDWRVCRDYVKAQLGIADGGWQRRQGVDISTPSRTPPISAPEAVDRIKFALKIWDVSESPGWSLTEKYLQSRGLGVVADLLAGMALRHHRACPFRFEDETLRHVPAMIGLFRDIFTDEPCGIHRTALKPDGSGKSDAPGIGNPKKMCGRARGAAIKLSPDEAVTHRLGIAEGIETALTPFCVGWRPMWALGSAGAVADFPVLPGVEALTVFADADDAGVKAARACQARWTDAGKECTIILPPADGQDWNDVMRAA